MTDNIRTLLSYAIGSAGTIAIQTMPLEWGQWLFWVVALVGGTAIGMAANGLLKQT